MKKGQINVLGTLLMVIFFSGPLSYAAHLTLETSYQSPQSVYKYLNLEPSPGALEVPCQVGKLKVDAQGNLNFCKGVGVVLGNNGDWVKTSIWSLENDAVYPTDTLNDSSLSVCFGTKTPCLKTTVNGSVLVSGTLGAGTPLPALAQGPGTRTYFDPNTGVFRSGTVTGNQWDQANLGINSAALGTNTIAKGPNSFVSGNISSVLAGNNNSVLGTDNTIHSGNNSSILAGKSHNLTGDEHLIAGGEANTINTAAGITGSAVMGGHNHNINGGGSVIVGGHTVLIAANNAFAGASSNSTINLGANNSFLLSSNTNTVNARLSGIGASRTSSIMNSANGSYNLIAAAQQSIIDGSRSAAIGGTDHNDILSCADATQTDSVILGGTENCLNATNSVIAGGSQNIISAAANQSFVGGGQNNHLHLGTNLIAVGGNGNVVGGGANNFIIGGSTDNVTGNNTGQLAGASNGMGGNNNISINGTNNQTFGSHNKIWGGNQNWIQNNAAYASILMGSNNKIADGNNNLILSNNINLHDADRNFVWGFPGVEMEIADDDKFLVLTGKVGINTIYPEGKLDVGGNMIAMLPNVSYVSNPLLFDINQQSVGVTEFIYGFDIAELFETIDEVTPGDLLVGSSERFKFTKSRTPYDKKVIGVVSAHPAMIFEGSQMQYAPAEGFTKGTKPPVALAGRVLCKVSVENGPIEAGDRLTTSSTPGHAMKATDASKTFGTVIGKALESFDGGPNGETTGLIAVLVKLQ